MLPKSRPTAEDPQRWVKWGPLHTILSILALTPSFLHYNSYSEQASDTGNQAHLSIKNKTKKWTGDTELARVATIQWLWAATGSDVVRGRKVYWDQLGGREQGVPWDQGGSISGNQRPLNQVWLEREIDHL